MRKQDQKCRLEMTTANSLEPVLVSTRMSVVTFLIQSVPRKNYD